MRSILKFTIPFTILSITGWVINYFWNPGGNTGTQIGLFLGVIFGLIYAFCELEEWDKEQLYNGIDE